MIDWVDLLGRGLGGREPAAWLAGWLAGWRRGVAWLVGWPTAAGPVAAVVRAVRT